jgi:hypothetical protein
MMFQGSEITMGAKNLLSYHMQLLRDESPLALTKLQKKSGYGLYSIYSGWLLRSAIHPMKTQELTIEYLECFILYIKPQY